MHADKFMKSMHNLRRRNSGSVVQYQNVISAANRKFMKDIIKNGARAIKGHSLDANLPFVIERCRKIDTFIGMKEINKRSNIFWHEGEALEILKDFGCRYDQEQVSKYFNLVKDFRQSLIENAGDEPSNDQVSTPGDNSFEKEYVYDKNERKKMLKKTCAQLNQKQENISKCIKKIERAKNSKKESQKVDRAQLVFMKKQLSLLEEIKGHLVKREENFLYYLTDQQRKDAQIFKAQKSKEQHKAKESNVKKFKQWRSERFKNFKNKIDRKDSRGIRSSQEIEKKRFFF